eukprot:6211079-Pleurochrysis_carterae.AAC.2
MHAHTSATLCELQVELKTFPEGLGGASESVPLGLARGLPPPREGVAEQPDAHRHLHPRRAGGHGGEGRPYRAWRGPARRGQPYIVYRILYISTACNEAQREQLMRGARAEGTYL